MKATTKSQPPSKRPKIKTSVVKFRADPEKKKQLKHLADLANLSMTELILKSTLETPPPLIQRADPALLRHLAAIGNNLNQIARTCNYRAKMGDPIDGVEVCLHLRRIRDEINNYVNPP
jgi:uncharacterized protein (DUF1778 family)